MKYGEYSRNIERTLRLQNLAWYLGSIAADRKHKKVIEMPKREQECGCVPCSHCDGEGFISTSTSEILIDCPKCGTTGFVAMCNKHWDEHHSSDGFEQTGLPESFYR